MTKVPNLVMSGLIITNDSNCAAFKLRRSGL